MQMRGVPPPHVAEKVKTYSGTVHTVPEQKLNNSKKMTTKGTWTFFLRRLFLFARLSYYFIAVLRLTKLSMLLSAPVLASTQQVSIVIIENVTDIFFPKWALLERRDWRGGIAL